MVFKVVERSGLERALAATPGGSAFAAPHQGGRRAP